MSFSRKNNNTFDNIRFDSVGDELRKIRVERRMGLNELAKKIGWDKSRLSKYENNHLAISLDAINTIAKGLDIRSPAIVIRFILKMYKLAPEIAQQMKTLYKDLLSEKGEK